MAATEPGRHGPGRPQSAAPAARLATALAQIGPPVPQARAAALELQLQLTKPPGSLGQLEELGVQLAGLSGECPPPVPQSVAIVVFAADHGVHQQGVTPWPQSVTREMVRNFSAGGAVINSFARQVGAAIIVADVGVSGPPIEPLVHPILQCRVRSGTADFTTGPALSRAEVNQAIEIGLDLAEELAGQGRQLLLAGDMGIANTTTSAALIAASLGLSAELVTGRGTGIDEHTLAHKVEVVARGIARHRDLLADPIDRLVAFGGLEHAATVGFLLGAAAARVPVILDGVITAAAALVAAELCPAATGAWIAGHLSVEPGARCALDHLGLRPLLDLQLRLGEGSGAALAVPLVQASARLLHEVATFAAAGVSGTDETQ